MYKINDQLPVKYHFSVHTSMPSYPTYSDFVFDVCSYLLRVHGQKKPVLTQQELKFSVKTLKYVFGTNMENEDFRIRLKEHLTDGIGLGHLQKNGEFIFISEESFTNYFSIV